MRFAWLVAGLFLLGSVGASAQTLRVPAFTAYVEPNPEGAEIADPGGVTQWKDGKNVLVWWGKFAAAGTVNAAVSLRLPPGEVVTLQLTVAGKAASAKVAGKGEEAVVVPLGTFALPKAGYQRFVLRGITKSGATFGNVEALLLSGNATGNAHFSLVERRNAASVHLGYKIPDGKKAAWFYNEVTARTEPLWTFYMACGFRRGYFGMQVNSPTERRIIFSVWDSGTEATDRSKVEADNRVQLLAKGKDVVAESFGNEGTGGHSHLVYNWKKGQSYRFLVTAEPEGAFTTYTGYFFFSEKQAWGLIARFRAPKDGGYLNGLHSFNENFIGANGQQRRLAEFGPQWMKTPEGDWLELTQARFTHDPHGKEQRTDYGTGVINGRFYLSNGGFVADPVKLGDLFNRPPSGKHPEIGPLP